MSGGERAGVGTMTVKVGERIWMGPFDVVGKVGDKLILGGSSQGEREKIPHSDALPAVARWLSETPNAVDRLWHVLDIYGNSAHAEVDAEQVLSSLLAALTGGEGESE